MSTMDTDITDPMNSSHTSVRGCTHPAPFSATEFSPVLLAHCYILGTIFNLLAVIAAFFLYRLVQIKARPLVLSVNILLVIMAALRYIYLAVDPYNVRMYFPTWFMRVLEDIAIPCLTSAFAIIQYALFQLCKVQRPNRRMQSPRVLWSIVVFHFAFVIVIDIVVILEVVGCWLIMLCHVFTLVWGLVLCVTVSMVALTLVSRNKRVKHTLRGDRETRLENGNPSSSTPNDTRAEDPALKDHLRKLKRICVSASITGLICFVVSLTYVILAAVDIEFGKVGWLLYQTMQRLVEIAFGFILLYISWQRADGPTPSA